MPQSEPPKNDILIVDDSQANLKVLMSMLTKQGYLVRPAINGQVALTAVREAIPDLILLDISMPDMDGYEVCKLLKSNPDARIRDIPIIFISIRENIEDKVKALKLGGVDYITKPFQIEEVIARVQVHLHMQAVKIEIQRKNSQLEKEISDRKSSEEKLHMLNIGLESQIEARTAEIKTEKEKSEVILSSVGDAIAMVDLQLGIQYINDSFTLMTGYSQSEAGKLKVDAWLHESVPLFERQFLITTSSHKEIWQGDGLIIRKDGRTYDASLTIAPMQDAEDNLTGFVISHKDISHFKDLERARNRFITNVSHELRTPVTNIKLYLNLLQLGRRPEKVDYYFQVMNEQIQRLEHLTQDILELTSLDSIQEISRHNPVSLPSIIETTITQYHAQAETSGLILEAPAPHPELPLVNGDQARLLQAVKELIENAISYTPSGGKITVESNTIKKEGQNWATITVKDDGPGISLEEQSQIFDRFFRGNLAESGHIPGTGLGLSIVKEIMRTHKGEIKVASELGQGSSFSLWFQPLS